jgi:hypothetical protein
LVVVSPRDPERVLAQVTELFADLPAVPRDVRPADSPTDGGPAHIESDRQRGDTMVWAIPGTPSGRAWAEVVCTALNRQRRGDDETASARVRCTYADDARRPLVAVRALGVDDPAALIGARLARLSRGDSAFVASQRDRVRAKLGQQLHVPLELARRLSQADPSQSGISRQLTPLGQLTGARALEEPGQAPELLLPVERGVLLVPARTPDPAPEPEASEKDSREEVEP